MHKKFAKSSLPGASCPKPPKSNTKNCFCKKERLILIHYSFQSLSQAKVIFQKKALSLAWKSQVYNATVKAQLMYGLETSALIVVQLNKLDTFQQRGLRAILNIEPAWISRVSNDSVMAQAVEALGKDIRLFSVETRAKKVLLLGHILRTTQ